MGLIFVVFGLNGFFMFIPVSLSSSPEAQSFIGGVVMGILLLVLELILAYFYKDSFRELLKR